jgi:cytochrome c-type biogenesis protein CcmE
MTQTIATPNTFPVTRSNSGRLKFLIGGLLIIGAIIYLIATATQSTAQYFLTVKELKERQSSLVGKKVRLSGAVVGETIQYNSPTLELKFTVANMPGDMKDIDAQGGLGMVLKTAVNDPNAARLNVFYKGPKPDLMKGEAQAIMDGEIRADGTFVADTLLMKCPTRYEGVPEQTN